MGREVIALTDAILLCICVAGAVYMEDGTVTRSTLDRCTAKVVCCELVYVCVCVCVVLRLERS